MPLRRPEGMAIRVKDSQNPALVTFEDIPNFPINPDWKIEAQLDWYDEPQDIQIPTVLGSERTQKCPAKLVFQVEDKVYELFPYKSFYGDPSLDRYFWGFDKWRNHLRRRPLFVFDCSIR